MSRRSERINDLLRELVAEIIARELKDPRLELELLSVTEVQVSADMRHARVHVSMLGSDEERATAVHALNHSSPYIRRLLKPRLSIKTIPALRFELDERMRRDQEMLQFIDRVGAEDRAARPEAAPADTPNSMTHSD